MVNFGAFLNVKDHLNSHIVSVCLTGPEMNNESLFSLQTL